MVLIPEHAVILVPTREDFIELATFLKANSEIKWNGGRDLLDFSTGYREKAVRISGNHMMTDKPVNYEQCRIGGMYSFVPEELFLISVDDFVVHCMNCSAEIDVCELL